MSDINIILADRPGLGRVRLCECNSIHISLGPVTINLEPSAFAQAAGLMREAMDYYSTIVAAKHAPCTSLDTFEPHPGERTQ